MPAANRLIAFQTTLALRFAGREVVELYGLTPDAAFALAGDGRPTWLLLPVGSLATQWAEMPPARAFATLREGPGVELAAAAGAWQLWHVGRPSTATAGP